MRWLITGGCGFIGRNLVRRVLADTAAAVRVVDDVSVGTREDLRAVADYVEQEAFERAIDWADWSRSRVELVAADIRRGAIARWVAAGADVVVHLAANTGARPSAEDPLGDPTP